MATSHKTMPNMLYINLTITFLFNLTRILRSVVLPSEIIKEGSFVEKSKLAIMLFETFSLYRTFGVISESFQIVSRPNKSAGAVHPLIFEMF